MIYYLEGSVLNHSSGKLRIAGPDANTYIQGQFSQDTRISDGSWVYGLWLDQKGRLVGDSHVGKIRSNEFLVLSHSLAGAALRQKLESCLVADDVELADESEQWECFLVWGEVLGAPAPSGCHVFPSRRAAPNAQEWLVPSAQVGEVRGCLDGVATRADTDQAEIARITAGLPAVPRDVGPRDLPQEAGLDDVAVSYNKGCYLGQEVMSRIHNLGSVRRRLHIVRGEGVAPAEGSGLFQHGNRVGEMRSTVGEGRGFIGLSMLTLLQLNPTESLQRAVDGAGDIAIVRRV